MPSQKKSSFVPPKAPLRLEFPSPEPAMVPPPLITVDPQLEKKLRERREEQKNWLFNEPEIFRDKFTDPFKPLTRDRDDSFKSFDERANRIFGPASAPDNKAKTQELFPLSSGEPLFSTDKEKERKSWERLEPTTTDSRDSRERDPIKNSIESAMKSLFGPKPETDKLPVLPGMSLYEMMDASQLKALKQQQQLRREEFDRFLSPAGSVPAGQGDFINLQEDHTRSPVNPITPVPAGNLPLPKSPLDRGVPLAPVDHLAHPRTVLEIQIPRQPLPVAAPLPENKTRQLESLKLMSRPSVLSFPGRQF